MGVLNPILIEGRCMIRVVRVLSGGYGVLGPILIEGCGNVNSSPSRVSGCGVLNLTLIAASIEAPLASLRCQTVVGFLTPLS